MTRIGIIGGGNIGEALIAGVVEGGFDPKHVMVSDTSPARLQLLQERFGVLTTSESVECAEEADYLFMCVKPDVVIPVLSSISERIAGNAAETVVVSVAAGVPIAAMEAVLAAGTPVIRVMPNTPMLVGKGTAGLAGGRYAESVHIDAVVELMRNTGRVVVVKEKDLDAVTAVSGSGPAYFFLVVEAMTDAGVQLGLPRPLAEELAVSTAVGSGAMLEQALEAAAAGEGHEDARSLRSKVTSPGGTTAAATRALEEGGLRAAFFRAMEACRDRSAELGAVQEPTK